MSNILELKNFSKSFRSHWTFKSVPAVKNVDLAIREGEVFGFLGHNGAGKTTTIKAITGLINVTGGEILYRGNAITDCSRKEIGYLPELPYFYDHLTVFETMLFFASLYGINKKDLKARVIETIKQVGLIDKRDKPVRSLSKGLQQRLGLAQAIINKPSLLLLDEPFSGLDPIGRMEVRNIILDLNKSGTTVFMSSHILSDVEDICSRVAIMSQGVLKAEFSLNQIAELYGESFVLKLSGLSESDQLHLQIAKLANSFDERNTQGGFNISYRFSKYEHAQQALRIANEKNIRIVSFSNHKPSLEDIFVEITKQDSGLIHNNKRVKTNIIHSEQNSDTKEQRL